MSNFRTKMLAPFRRQHSRNGKGRPLTPEEWQAQEHARDPFWKMLTSPKPDKSKILLEIDADQTVLQKRDPAGATPLLYLALLNSEDHVDIAKELLQRDLSKRRITDRYDHEPYTGENILHIAIVNKDLSFAKTLLEMNQDILSDRATGTFFKKGGSCPWGELPLSFAAASNQPQMVDLLLNYGADISGKDEDGYTAMHIAVRFNMQAMYKKLAAIYETKNGEDNLKMLERSCLRFAAFEGCKEMFGMILDRSSQMLWQYGPISAFSYPISFLDSKVENDEHSLNQKSAMQILIDNEQLKLIVSPVVSEFIRRKWDKYGAKRFKKRFVSFAVYLVVFTLAIILPDCRSPASGPVQRWTRVGCEIIILGGACVKGYIELLEMSEEGLISHFWRSAGAIKIENFSSATACFSVLAAALLRVSPIDHQSDYEECFLVIAALSAWGYAFFFLLGWKFTGPFVLMFVKVIQKDVAVLGLIFLVILGGFTSCSIILGVDDGFAAATAHAWNCSTAVLGDPTFTQSTPHHHPLKSALNVWLSFSFVFVNGVILLNLLIAKMGDTYRHYEESAEESWQMERARVLESFDREMDDSEKDNLLQYCWIRSDTSEECFLLLERKNPNFYHLTSPGSYTDNFTPEEIEEQVEEAEGNALGEADTTQTPTRNDQDNNGRVEGIGDMNNVDVDKKLRQFSPVLHSVFGGTE